MTVNPEETKKKEKIDDLDFLKIKNSYTSNESKKMKNHRI